MSIFYFCDALVPFNTQCNFFQWKPWRLKGYFQFKINLNVLVSSFWFTWMLILWFYGNYKYFNSFSAGTVFVFILTSTDVRFWRKKTVTTLKELTSQWGLTLYVRFTSFSELAFYLSDLLYVIWSFLYTYNLSVQYLWW